MHLMSRSKIFWPVLTVILNSATAIRRESSAEYLQNVMFELQELNLPSCDQKPRHNFTGNVNDHVNDVKMLIRNDEHRNDYANRKVNTRQDNRQTGASNDPHRFDSSIIDHYDILNDAAPETASNYYQVRIPNSISTPNVREPNILGFTRTELAAMYKDALSRGQPISFSSLTNALTSGRRPQVVGTHLEIPTAVKPPYQYYFFPLKTFMSELNKDNGYKPLSVPSLPSFEGTDALKASQQNQLSNPLFVAISTFVSMALLFMMGVLFFPKLGQLADLYPRHAQDDLLHLTRIVTNATNLPNFVNEFEKQHVNSKR